jgi:hypothetical protein
MNYNDIGAQLRKRGAESLMNVRDVSAINRILWSFNYCFRGQLIPPNSTQYATISISAEAGFLWTGLIKTVYQAFYSEEEPELLTALAYRDPLIADSAVATPGLKMSLTDGGSGLSFFNKPVNLDAIGVPEFPTLLGSPVYLQPNTNVTLDFSNENESTYYQPFVILTGYRARIEDVNQVLAHLNGGSR